ncbi:MAG: SCO family protein [Bradymonadales bacterium]|nr:MAG: SCO family protein [Bradymonadales bacterium]
MSTRLRNFCSFFGLLVVALGSFELAAQGYGRASAPEGFGLGVHRAPENLEDIEIVDRTGERVDFRAIELVDEFGETRNLEYYFGQGKPILITMVYFNCPSLCGLVLNGVKNSTRRVDWTPGREYIHLTISIDPDEDYLLASEKKETYIREFGRPEAARGWHFLTGEEDQVRSLANQLGFGYRFVEETREYAHSAGIFVLTPAGVISRVLYGVEYDPRDLRLSLIEAARGGVGSLMDRILLYCYRYDPDSGGYSFYAMRLMRVGGAVTLAVLVFFMLVAWRREKKKPKKREES